VTPETLRRLDELFRSEPVLCGGSVPAAEIELAERLVGKAFPADYWEFIERYGGAMVESLPILGLRQAEVMGDDTFSVVDVTARFRADCWYPTDNWVVISMDLAGNPIGLTSEGEVWVSDHDTGEIRMLAATFEGFVIQLLDDGAGPVSSDTKN
jgi:hypothetical protein